MREQLTVAATGPADIAVAFSQILRAAGLSVPTSCTNTYAEALCATGITDRDTTYWAGRATLVRHPEDVAMYDRAFAVFFEQLRSGPGDDGPTETVSITIAVDTDDTDDATGERRGRPIRRRDRTAVLVHRDPAQQGLRHLFVRRTDPGP